MKSDSRSINVIYLIILSAVSFSEFVFKSHSAYEWPAIDMIPFFERYKDKDFLLNDFYTNSISDQPNPRWIFGYFVIALSKIFHADYYAILFALKTFLVITMPALFYLIMYYSAGKIIPEKNRWSFQIILLVAVLIIMHPRINGIFSIAWWPPYIIQAASQTMSMFFGLLAIVLSGFNLSSRNSLYSLLFFALSTLMHPSIGLFVIVFFCLVNYTILLSNIKYFIAIFIFSFLAPISVLNELFSPIEILDSFDFVNIYVVENHSSHYHLVNFGSLTPLSWLFSFGFMIVLLIIPLIYSIRNKCQKSQILNLLFLGSLLLCLLLQYVFIDIFPSKIISSIGPIRFSLFTYWMITILWSVMISNSQVLRKLSININLKMHVYFCFIGLLFFIGTRSIDSPKKDLFENDKDMYEFITRTNEESVFVVFFGNYQTDIPIVSNRAVFTGNGFPFNESYFEEHQRRRELVLGSRDQIDKMEGNWEGVKMANFFRQKTPEYFWTLSKEWKMDYLVIESEFSTNFSSFSPIFQNSKVKIYRINDFKKVN